MSFEASVLFASWIAILLLSLAVSALARQVSVLNGNRTPPEIRLGPPVGSIAPPVPQFPGNSQKPRLLLFLDAGCDICDELAVAILRNSLASLDDVSPLVLFSGSVPSHLESPISRGNQKDLFGEFSVSIAPFAVVLGEGNIVLRASPVGSSITLDLLLTKLGEERADA